MAVATRDTNGDDCTSDVDREVDADTGWGTLLREREAKSVQPPRGQKRGGYNNNVKSHDKDMLTEPVLTLMLQGLTRRPLRQAVTSQAEFVSQQHANEFFVIDPSFASQTLWHYAQLQ